MTKITLADGRILDTVTKKIENVELPETEEVSGSSLVPKPDHSMRLEVNRQLESKGILVKNGAIVDATIISSSRRPKKIDDLVTEDRKRRRYSRYYF